MSHNFQDNHSRVVQTPLVITQKVRSAVVESPHIQTLQLNAQDLHVTGTISLRGESVPSAHSVVIPITKGSSMNTDSCDMRATSNIVSGILVFDNTGSASTRVLATFESKYAPLHDVVIPVYADGSYLIADFIRIPRSSSSDAGKIMTTNRANTQALMTDAGTTVRSASFSYLY